MSLCLLLLIGVGYYLGTRSFMERAGAVASEEATGLLPVRVSVGSIRIDSLHALTAEDLVVYDRSDSRMAEAESVTVDFSLFSMFSGSPVNAIHEIVVRQPQAVLEQRKDGSWNYEDLISGSRSENAFRGVVRVENGRLTGRMDGRELLLENLNGSFDLAEHPSVRLKADFTNHEAKVALSGSVGGERQTLSVDGSGFVLEDYLAFLPAGTLPEEIQVQSGTIDKLTAVLVKTGDNLSYSGQAEFSHGQVEVMGTAVTDIQGLLTLNEREISVFANAAAQEQKASVHGRIRLDTPSPYMNLVVESQSFDPGRILQNSPFHGKAAFTANVSGTAQDPKVDGEVHVNEGSVYGYSFANAKAKVRYEDSRIAVRDFAADVFGGHLQAEGEFSANDYSYTGHARAAGIDAEALADFLPQVSGRLSADVGFSGRGNDINALNLYGSASGRSVSYNGLTLPSITTSFYMNGPEVHIDALNAELPGNGVLNAEGSIMNRQQLDLDFYGSHVDLSLLQNFIPQADVTGFTDITGAVHGDISNPMLQISLTALEGSLFKQPFHKLETSVSGSLDGVRIDSFTMENDGRETWDVQGQIGFAGERRIQLQVDTTGARMEDIAALVAPDQPITGNVDNILTITGTLDDPNVVGYIHFYRGSYAGLILSGMDGDYTIKNKIVTLQDFHIYSPLVDMDLNGTIDPAQNLNLRVSAHDIDVERFGRKLPYPISGHGKFDGLIGGTLNDPMFDGELLSPQLVVNGQTVTNARGKVRYRGHRVYMEGFHFEQNGGSYDLTAQTNTATLAVNGRMDVNNADVNALMAMFNLKNDILNGRMGGSITLAGTLSNPRAHLTGFIGKGDVKGYALSDIYLDLSLADRVISIDKFTGKQAQGIFAAEGTVNLDGPIDARFSARDLQVGLFVKAAGVDADARGLVNLNAQVGGTVDNPSADVSLDVAGGGVGATTFDSLNGLFNLKNGIIQVNQFIVKKKVQQKVYKASAYGSVPLTALTSAEENLNDYEQFNLRLSLDEADLSLLPLLSKQIDWALGETDGILTVTGTAKHPLVHGQLRMKNGAMKLKALRQPVTEMNVDIRFNGDTVKVEDVSGHIGRGSYKLAGTARFAGLYPEDYDFSLLADQLDLDCAFYKGPLSGTLRLNKGEFFGHMLPKVTGAVEIANTTVSIPAIPDSSGELPDVMLDLDLKLGKKVHFYSPFLYDMQLAGSAHFGGTTRFPKSSGTISVLRGTVSYLKTKFTIREGEMHFNQVHSFLPSIVFRADTKLDKTRVYLSIDGPVEQMEFHMTSVPELSETEIMQLLTLRSNYRSGQSQEMDFSSMLNVGLQMSFLSEVEGVMRDALNLDEFSIGRDTSESGRKNSDNNAREVYNVEMGKYISDKVMIKYTQGIGTDTRRYGIQYDFNDHMSLTTQRTQDNATVVGLEARFKF